MVLFYIGNVVSDAQIALYLYKDYPIESSDGDDHNYAFTSYIPQTFLAWAVRDYHGKESRDLPKCLDFVCNGDIMFHTNKGLLRLH